jgi:hypothetical protein
MYILGLENIDSEFEAGIIDSDIASGIIDSDIGAEIGSEIGSDIIESELIGVDIFIIDKYNK